MRTKQCLAALCLPLAFAACSNEDFVTETPSLSNRGTVNVAINAQKPSFNDVDTRMSIDGNNNFLWEKDFDKIGAAMADGATFDNIQDKVLVNYPFTAQSSGTTSTFNAKSSIAKGNYLFYYGYTDVVDREYLDLSLPAQKYDVTSEKTPIQQAANHMKMISPIVKLGDGVGYDDAQGYNLNLSFANLYTMVKVTINSKNFPKDVTPKVEKVTLNAVTTGFVKQAHAKMTVIDDAGIVTPDAETKQIKEADMTAAITNLNTLISNAANGTVSTIYDQTGVTTANGPAEMKVVGDLNLSTAESTVLYILAPKGTYNDGLTLTVETSEGTYTKTISKPSGKDLVLADDIQKIGADLDFSLDGTGNVKLPETFAIASTEDWTHAVEFVTNHSVAYINKSITFSLTKDIEIPALPTFKLTIIGTQTLTLASNYTINDKNADQFTASNITLGVKAGATLTLADDATAFAGVKNNGILNVNADQSKAITNYGTMNVNADATLTGGLTNGKAKTLTDPAVAGTVNIIGGKILTITTTALSNVVGNINVLKSGSDVGKLVINSASTNKGTITNNGEISGPAAITNANGIIDNFGALKASVTNANGLVIIEKNSVSNGVATITDGVAEVKDVTTFATTQGVAGNKYTFATAIVTTEVNTTAEYKKADEVASKITNITLNGGEWTLASTAGGDASKTIAAPTSATGLTLKGATLNLTAALANKAIIADGTSSIKASATLSITEATLIVNAGATLTVNDKVTVNAAESANSKTATILGTLNVEAGAKMYFATATVGSSESSAGVLTIKGNTATNAIPGEFGVKTPTNFDNYGMVQSLSGTNDSAAAGKVSQPVNKTNDATFKGNATAISFI